MLNKLKQLIAVSTTLTVLTFAHIQNASSAPEYDSRALEEAISKVLSVQEDASLGGQLLKIGRYDIALQSLPPINTNSNSEVFAQTFLSFYLSGQYLKAVEICEKWLSLNDSSNKADFSFVHELIGTCYYQLDEFDKALLEYSRAIDCLPTESAYISRAVCHKALGSEQLANEDYVKGNDALHIQKLPTVAKKLEVYALRTAVVPMVEIDPATSQFDSKAWREALPIAMKARTLEKSGKYEEAIRMYQSATSVCDSNPSLWAAFAICAMTNRSSDNNEKDRQNEVVQSYFKKALLCDNSDWRILNDFGLFQYLTDNHVGAKESFQMALIDKKSIDAFQVKAIERAILQCNRMELLDRLKSRM